MCSVTFDLLVRGYGAKDNLSELASFEGAISNPSAVMDQSGLGKWNNQQAMANLPHHLQRLLHNGNRQMCPIIDEPCNVVLGHLGKLFLKDAF